MKFHNPNGDYVMLTNLSTKSKNRIPSLGVILYYVLKCLQHNVDYDLLENS